MRRHLLAVVALTCGVPGLAFWCPRAAAQDVPPPVPNSPVQTVSETQGSLELLTGERIEERPEGEDEIETDRDSFTPATTLAGRGRLILETAYSFVDSRQFKDSHSFPEAIARYGLTDRLELRLGWNAEIGGGGNPVSGHAAGGGHGEITQDGGVEREYVISYGVKVRITDQDRWLPRSIAILQGFTPTGGSPGTSTATRLVATYAAGWAFPNRWQFDAAMRYGFASEEGDRFNEWAPSAVLRAPLGEKWATHVEYFGVSTTGRERNATQHYISPGVHYLLTPDLELGIRVGWGLNDQSARFFANGGIGWRL
jgi:hypothetical protein